MEESNGWSSSKTPPIDFVCPSCSNEISLDGIECERCGATATIRSGIPSFLEKKEGDNRVDERVVNLFESRRLLEIVEDFDNGSAVDEFIQDTFHGHLDDWRILVDGILNGQCLVLYSGQGSLPFLVAETADSVYTIDSSLLNLRILAAREDFVSRTDVYPIHTCWDNLPFPDHTFDTIIVDNAAIDKTDASLKSHIELLKQYLGANGSLIVKHDGPTQLIQNIINRENENCPKQNFSKSTFANYRKSRKLLHSTGFDHVETFALLPSAHRIRVVFNTNHSSAINWYLTNQLNTRYTQLMQALAGIGMLKYCCPGYLAIGTNESFHSANFYNQESEYILSCGRGRSILLEISKGELQNVLKVPNKRSNIQFNLNELTVRRKLRSHANDLVDTVPTNRTISTPFGPTLQEEPAVGTPMKHVLKDDLESFEWCLEVGLKWLARFQIECNGGRIIKNSEEVQRDLRFKPMDLEPPTFKETIEIFETPTHGDFLPGNIFVDNTGVSQVIDWEYGRISGNPIIDSGFFVLHVLKERFDSFEQGAKIGLMDKNQYATTTSRVVNSYCNTVDISLRAFVSYLPIAYISRMNQEYRELVPPKLAERNRKRARRIQYLWDNSYSIMKHLCPSSEMINRP